MADTNELIDVCTDLIRLVEGVGCKDWRDQNGQRFKDTNEWVRAYVAINNARKESREQAIHPADAALADDALCESLIEASDMRWNGDVYVGDGSDLMSLVRAALRARAVPEGKKYHDVAQRLYALLDDIDTAGDIAKSDDKLYRGIVERTQAKKRDFVVSCDGYTVTLADDSMLTASKEAK